MYITKDYLRASFEDYVPIDEVYSINSKLGIATSDFEVLVTLTRPKFNEVPNTITCGGRTPGNVASDHKSDTTGTTNTGKVPSGPVEWTEVVRREAKATAPPP